MSGEWDGGRVVQSEAGCYDAATVSMVVRTRSMLRVMQSDWSQGWVAMGSVSSTGQGFVRGRAEREKTGTMSSPLTKRPNGVADGPRGKARQVQARRLAAGAQRSIG
jgi:hypothetical protein